MFQLSIHGYRFRTDKNNRFILLCPVMVIHNRVFSGDTCHLFLALERVIISSHVLNITSRLRRSRVVVVCKLSEPDESDFVAEGKIHSIIEHSTVRNMKVSYIFCVEADNVPIVFFKFLSSWTLRCVVW
jgi:hypothetical protein